MCQLSKRKIGDVLSIIGPIGNGFEFTDKKRPLLIGGGVGMPPMIAIAQQIKDKDHTLQLLPTPLLIKRLNTDALNR
jgi:NAD(P)H-flavin reductase